MTQANSNRSLFIHRFREDEIDLWFKKGDVNQDGSMSADEFNKYKSQFFRLFVPFTEIKDEAFFQEGDKNNDKFLSKTEHYD